MTNTRRDDFAASLEKLINNSEKTQHQIAMELNYENPNIITMFKKGTTRVPLDRVVRVAMVLGVDPADLLRDWFEAYMPGVLDQIEPYIGMPLNARERGWIRSLRHLFGAVPAYRREWDQSVREIVRRGAPRSEQQ